MIDFTLNPDHNFARIVRFRPASEFPSATTLAMLDPGMNVLLVNRSIYDQLPDGEKGRVLKTRSLHLEVAE